jgi:predicted metalloprotease
MHVRFGSPLAAFALSYAIGSSRGGDRLQRQALCIALDSFTHRSPAQRVRSFRRGLRSGGLEECDTP